MTTQVPNTMLEPSARFSNTRVLDGSSVASSQQPSALDTPLQVEFGPAVGSGATDVALSVAGALTVNVAGVYRIEISLQFGRTGGSAVSKLMFRAKVNGAQAGATIMAHVDAAAVLTPFNEKSTLNLPAGAVLTWEIARSSAGSGNNSGGLFAGDVAGGWNAAPCARIRVDRLR